MLENLFPLFLEKNLSRLISTTLFVHRHTRLFYRRPLWFDYFKPLAESITRALNTVTLPLNRYMTRASVNIGHLGQDTSDISENLNAVSFVCMM